jgi:hypothetical protein
MAVTASNNDLWSQAATALRIGATSKASYGPPCQPGDPRSSLQTYREVCPKVSSIPDAIIDAASVPYLKRYLTEADAKTVSSLAFGVDMFALAKETRQICLR